MAPKIDPNNPSTRLPENVNGKFEYTVEEDLNADTRKVQIKTDSKTAESVAAGRAVALAHKQKNQLLMARSPRKTRTNSPKMPHFEPKLPP